MKPTPPTDASTDTPVVECPNCMKHELLCVCGEIVPIKTRAHVLILQHPQEPDKELGTARLAHLSLPNSTLKIGLSWRNLGAVLGREADPQKWAVLYLGSGAKAATETTAQSDSKSHADAKIRKGAKAGGTSRAAAQAAKAALAAKVAQALKPAKGDAETLKPHPEVQLLSRQGVPLPDSDALIRGLQGLVVLDGTWSQAKTLWWRNAWLLKLRRAVLTPEGKSLYGELRREPRRECLSTLESIGLGLVGIGEDPAVETTLNELFKKLLDRKRALKKPRRAPDRRS